MESMALPDLPPEQIGEAIRAFMAKDCPACGVDKFILEDPFCDVCLGLLPSDIRDKVSENTHFIATFHPAMTHLRSVHAVTRSNVNDPNTSQPAA